jgi:excisionase family DNA binding protein
VAPTDHIQTPGRADETVSQLVSAFERAMDMASLGALAHLLGSLERLKAIAWGRLLATSVPTERPRTEPLEELRHLTPIQVAKLLSLKEAYVHELCRSRKIPATKRGKYWIIPVAELREWLGRGQGIDPRRSGSLGLPARPGTTAANSGNPDLPPVAPAGAPWRRRAPIDAIQQQAASKDTNTSRTEGPRSQ